MGKGCLAHLKSKDKSFIRSILSHNQKRNTSTFVGEVLALKLTFLVGKTFHIVAVAFLLEEDPLAACFDNGLVNRKPTSW